MLLFGAIACQYTMQPHIIRRNDSDRAIHDRIETDFEEQRHDLHDHLTRHRERFALCCKATYFGVHDRIESFALRRIVKDDLGHRGPIECAVTHNLWPTCRNHGQARCTRRNRLAREFVGIDQQCAEFGEDRSDLTLTTTDTTRKSNAHACINDEGAGNSRAFASIRGSSLLGGGFFRDGFDDGFRFRSRFDFGNRCFRDRCFGDCGFGDWGFGDGGGRHDDIELTGELFDLFR